MINDINQSSNTQQEADPERCRAGKKKLIPEVGMGKMKKSYHSLIDSAAVVSKTIVWSGSTAEHDAKGLFWGLFAA